MPHLTPRNRPEPPLTGPRRAAPGARAEPPLTAARPAAARAEPAPRPAIPAAPARPERDVAPQPQALARPDPQPQPQAWGRPDPRPQPQRPVEGFELAEARPMRLAPEAPRPQPAAAPFPAAQAAAQPARPAAAQPQRDAELTLAEVWPEPAANTLRRAPARPRDPAPSRLSYRMHRLWLTPLFRSLVRVGLPAFAFAFGVGIYLSDEGRREALAATGTEMVRSVQERPEFMVNMMAVEGASPALGQAIRTVLPVDFPVSSFDLDLETMRASVAGLDAVASADLRIRPGGILEVRVTERVPAILWRGPDGLTMLDDTGHPVARIGSRLERPDLPVIAGDGADAAVPEAMRLIEAAAPVSARLRGLVRMGARRWDVVLDNGQRILLPETGAVTALERVMALDEAEDMLARDVSVIDMRNAARPTLRLSPNALNELRRVREIETGATNG